MFRSIWSAGESGLVGLEADVATHIANVANPHAVTKGQVGLDLVDNTSDTNKPVSTAQQTALDLKANITSPTFTGTPAAPTPTLGDTTTKIATMAAVSAAVAAGIAGLVWKPPVEVVAITNVALTGEQTIDGVLTLANRVAVVGQTAPAENGIYVSAAGAWARATDMDGAAEFPNAAFLVRSGSKSGSQWKCTNTTNPVVGTDPIVITQIGAGLLLDYASQAEAEAGTENTEVMTSLRTRENVLATPMQLPADVAAKIAAFNIGRWPQVYDIFEFQGGDAERAKGSGHATADFQPAFTDALSSGEEVNAPSWEYPLRTYAKPGTSDGTSLKAIVYVSTFAPINVNFGPLAKIVIPDTLLHVGGVPDFATIFLVRQVSGSAATIRDYRTLKMRGGIVDTRALTATYGYVGGAAGASVLTAYDYAVDIEGMLCDTGDLTPVGAGENAQRFGAGFLDTAFAFNDCPFERVVNNRFIGYYDVAIYLNGDSSNMLLSSGPGGQNSLIAHNKFWNCGMAATAKRFYRDIDWLHNKITRCYLGFQHQSAGVGDGTKGTFSGNLYYQTGQPLRIVGDDAVVSGERIVAFGHWLDGSNAKIDGASGILALNAKNTRITDSIIRQEGANWLADVADATPVRGITLSGTTDRALVDGMRVENVGQSFVDISTGNNRVANNNDFSGEVVPSVYKYHTNLGA